MSDLYRYAGHNLDSQAEWLEHLPTVKQTAEHAGNLVRPDEDIMERSGFILGDAPGEWREVPHLTPYVQLRLMLQPGHPPHRFTYWLATDGKVTTRHLAVQLDVITPSTHPVTPMDVKNNEQAVLQSLLPFIQRFFPLHKNVGFNVSAHNPVPRVNADTGEAAHLRTAVLVRCAATDTDVLNRERAPRRKVQLLGPDGRPA